MNSYITGPAIKQFRETRGLTQAQVAQKIGVSDKAVSKWETGRGLPDLTLLETLAKVLGVSVMELMQGERIVNCNVSCSLRRSNWYVCPVCGNILHTTGNAAISCCGIALPPLEAEECDELHEITIEKVEDEQFVTVHHEMTREHYISFIAYVTDDRVQMVKLYPEGNAETRLNLRGRGKLYLYCNRHGLMTKRV